MMFSVEMMYVYTRAFLVACVFVQNCQDIETRGALVEAAAL